MWLDKPKYHIKASFRIDQGERDNQEDIGFSIDQQCYMLADGAGGMPNGEKAAAIAIETVNSVYSINRKKPTHLKDKRYFLQSLFSSADRALKNNPETRESATTLSLLFFAEHNFYVGNCGDSRIFLFRNTSGKWLTPLDRDEMGYLTRALGNNLTSPEVFIDRMELLLNDIFFIGTDGICDWINERELSEHCLEVSEGKKNMDSILQELFTIAKNRGSTDNISAWLVLCTH